MFVRHTLQRHMWLGRSIPLETRDVYRQRVSPRKCNKSTMVSSPLPLNPPRICFVGYSLISVCARFHQAPAKKSHKSTKPPENAAGRVNKQPPAKAKSTTASSSRQSAGPVKGAGSSKTTQKSTQKPEAVVGKSGNKRKAAEAIEEDEERTIFGLSLYVGGGNLTNKATPTGPGVAKMPILTSRVRTIREDIVASKWAPMSEKAQGEVFDVLKAAEIPVLMTFKKDKQKALAQEGLRIVMRRYDDTPLGGGVWGAFISNMAKIIIGRLRVSMTKIPVPPMGRDTALSYERLVDKNVSWYLGVLRFHWVSSLVLTRIQY